jgi:hypothetical protein
VSGGGNTLPNMLLYHLKASISSKLIAQKTPITQKKSKEKNMNDCTKNIKKKKRKKVLLRIVQYLQA